MKHLKIFLTTFTFVFFIIACRENAADKSVNQSNAANLAVDVQPTAAPDEFAAAGRIYAENCAKCHKEDGTGGKIEIDGETLKVTNLTSDHLKKDPDGELIEQIEKGGDGMPAYKNKLSDEEIKDLVKFIRIKIQKQ